MSEQGTLKTLFQQEFTKMVAVISSRFGLQHIELAEDIVSETFLVAAETWGMKGMPPNPTAWLYAVARQKALYHLRRNKILEEKVIPEVIVRQDIDYRLTEADFTFQNIRDSQLQMMFAVCDPVIASEAQIGLALRILCGFGIDEIAEAFLSNKETINKRLFRAKEKLREAGIRLELPPEAALERRLDNVLHIIYLLFSEGYYSKTQNELLRKDLCLEAMRLCISLTEYEKTNVPKTNALLALMCFHASRFNARQAGDGLHILYHEQNEDLWDAELVNRGIYFLDISAEGNEVTTYHLEARIAYWHCRKEDTREKWQEILQLYNQLLHINFSPSVFLNRIYALYKVKGREAALAETQKITLGNNHFYFVLLAELYRETDKEAAKLNLRKALALARTETEKQGILSQLEKL